MEWLVMIAPRAVKDTRHAQESTLGYPLGW
jgi:hypothetical protein